MDQKTAVEMTSRYKVIHIKKANGKTRIIHEPNPELKAKQRQLLHHLYRTGEGAGPYAFGFVRGKGIREHAAAHLGRQYIVRIDIEDFFPSVTPEHLRSAWEFDQLLQSEIDTRFMEAPLDLDPQTLPAPIGLVQFSFIKSPKDLFKLGLPQGSPISPALANLAMKQVDFTIVSLLRKWGPKDARYTRYADDLMISSNSSAIIPMAKPIRKILRRFGFQENRKKFRVMRKSGRQVVCGVIVNEKMSLPREKRKEYRGRIHRLFKMVVDEEDQGGNPIDWQKAKEEFRHIEGYFSHARHVAPEFAKKYLGKIAALKELLEGK